MGFQSFNELEAQRQRHMAQNEVLSQHIYNHKDNKKILKRKKIQIVRCGDWVFALDRSTLVGRGGFGQVYRAYPIIQSGEEMGKIDREKEVIFKIMSPAKRRPKKKQVVASEEAIQERRNRHVIQETRNDQASFSARATLIPRPQKKGGVPIYDRVVIKSAIPGCNVERFLKRHGATLTPLQRTRLCRNVIIALMTVHKKGVFYGDIKPSNLMVDPETLEVKFIDSDGTGRTNATVAPEDYKVWLEKERFPRPTREADIYSMAQGLLIPILVSQAQSFLAPIFKDQYFCHGAFILSQSGRITEVKDMKDFDNHPIRPGEKAILQSNLQGFAPPEQVDALVQVLDEMRLENPEKRCSLEKPLAVFDKILAGVEVSPQEEESHRQKKEAYERQLWVLDEMLADPKYKVPAEVVVPEAFEEMKIEEQVEAPKKERVSESVEEKNEKELHPNFALKCLGAISDYAEKNPKKTAAIAVVGCVAIIGVTIFLSGGFAAVPWLAVALVLAKPPILGTGIGMACSFPFFRNMYRKAVDEKPSPQPACHSTF